MSVRSTVQLSEPIQDIHTEIVINTYIDRILILITQLGKVGNLIQASIPPTASQLSSLNRDDDETEKPETDVDVDLPQPSPAIQLTNLLGVAPNEQLQTLHSLYASYAATLTWMIEESNGQPRVPVIVGIALKKVSVEEEERRIFLEIMQKLKQLLARRYIDTS